MKSPLQIFLFTLHVKPHSFHLIVRKNLDLDIHLSSVNLFWNFSPKHVSKSSFIKEKKHCNQNRNISCLAEYCMKVNKISEAAKSDWYRDNKSLRDYSNFKWLCVCLLIQICACLYISMKAYMFIYIFICICFH